MLSHEHWYTKADASKGTKVVYRFKGSSKTESRTFKGSDHGSKAFHFFKTLKPDLEWHSFQGVN